MKILVCGGREYFNMAKVKMVLDEITNAENQSYLSNSEYTIIEGGAKGADFLAKAWTTFYNIDFEEYPAMWKKHGRYKAGPIRNQQMIDEGDPDLVVAFPGGTGTADMVRRARKHNIEVIEVED